jgi:hypothetical protein
MHLLFPVKCYDINYFFFMPNHIEKLTQSFPHQSRQFLFIPASPFSFNIITEKNKFYIIHGKNDFFPHLCYITLFHTFGSFSSNSNCMLFILSSHSLDLKFVALHIIGIK